MKITVINGPEHVRNVVFLQNLPSTSELQVSSH